MSWEWTLGAHVEGGGVRFRVWAPKREKVELFVESRPGLFEMTRDGDGYWAARVEGVGAGVRYGYRVDGAGPFPDPASSSQPEGVHGLSEVVDASRFAWSDGDWRPPAASEAVVYELHVGTFTPGGTLVSAMERLGWLRELGVNVIELMPIAAFPGRWNWGYDGVSLFAPFAGYGTPEELCAFVDAAHAEGLAIILDVVFNHFGPDGNYTGVYSDAYLTGAHETPWGGAINFAAEDSAAVRAFYRENVLHWLHVYHFDGFRFDATHAIFDGSGKHILAELSDAARTMGRQGIVPLLIAETHENDPRYVLSTAGGGFGFDAVWADDFHHCARTAVVDEHEGYFQNFDGALETLARCLRQGFLFEGQENAFSEMRGKRARDVPWHSFVYCLQNHDQVGNRAFGERLSTTAALADVRALTTLMLLLPQIPMLFQGQEFFATTPFLYFTDHSEPLGGLVVEGRRREFGAFTAFRDERVRELIPSPQDPATFKRSKLHWVESSGPGALAAGLHRELLRLRRELPVLRQSRAERGTIETSVHGDAMSVTIANEAGRAAIVLNLGAETSVPVGIANGQVALSSEEGRFGGTGREPELRGGFLWTPGHCATLSIEG